MFIHHLNCTTMCAIGGRLMDGMSSSLTRAHLVCHCMLVETGDGLVLIDTGFGLKDVAAPFTRISRFFLAQLRPQLEPERTALRQIEALGLEPREVRHIVLTHLDFDHAGGLDDFPWATVHLLASEKAHALAQKTVLDRMRFRPQQWSTMANWRTYQPGEGESWFGFDAVRSLEGLPPEILMVPLIGHTFGHAGVAVNAGDKWQLLAGDAYFYRHELDPDPHCTPGLRFYQRMMEKDRKARLWNQDRLRALKRDHSDRIDLFSGHDALELEDAWARSLPIPRQHAPSPQAGITEAEPLYE